jgi:hypothetical protein
MSYRHKSHPRKPYHDKNRRYKYPWLRRPFITAEERKQYSSDYEEMKPFYWSYLKRVLDKSHKSECFVSLCPTDKVFIAYNYKTGRGIERRYENKKLVSSKRQNMDYPWFLSRLKSSIHYWE